MITHNEWFERTTLKTPASQWRCYYEWPDSLSGVHFRSPLVLVITHHISITHLLIQHLFKIDICIMRMNTVRRCHFSFAWYVWCATCCTKKTNSHTWCSTVTFWEFKAYFFSSQIWFAYLLRHLSKELIHLTARNMCKFLYFIISS